MRFIGSFLFQYPMKILVSVVMDEMAESKKWIPNIILISPFLLPLLIFRPNGGYGALFP